jgi:cytochrome c556
MFATIIVLTSSGSKAISQLKPTVMKELKESGVLADLKEGQAHMKEMRAEMAEMRAETKEYDMKEVRAEMAEMRAETKEYRAVLEEIGE